MTGRLTARQAAQAAVRGFDPHNPDAARRIVCEHAATPGERRAIVALLPSMVRDAITAPRGPS